MFRPLSGWFLLLALLGAGELLAAPEISIGAKRAPYVQLTTRSSAVLVWRTIGAISPQVRYGTVVDQLDQILPVDQIVTRVSPDVVADPEPLRLAPTTSLDTYQYEAHINGLEEDTQYFYGVYDGDILVAGCDPNYSLRTQPARDVNRPLRFWVLGDSGNGSDEQKAVFTAMKAFVAADQRPLDAFIHLGDLAYQDGTDGAIRAHFFRVYSRMMRNTVTWATMGNHEGHSADGTLGVGPYFDAMVHPMQGEAGGVPSGSEAYYSFDFGPIHFVCLNSHDEARAEAGRMATWLKQDLAQNTAEWLIAFWHHPPYSQGSHNSDSEIQLIEMREIMVPILEEHGVDLILAGHSHIYERSMLLDGAYKTPTDSIDVVLDDGDGNAAGDGSYRKSAQLHAHEGSVAVVAGHGRGTSFVFGLSPVHRVSIQEPGSVLLDLEGDTLKVRMLNSDAVVRDEFQLIKRDTVAARAPIADPWNPFGPALVSGEFTPHRTQAHLIPQPNVPDATVYYTTDGTDPTTASLVFENALEINGPTVIKAMSVWRGGERTSPISTREVAPQAPSLSKFVRIPVLFSEDDATETNLGLVDLKDSTVGMTTAETSQYGLRFRKVGVPRGATILSSFLLLRTAALDVDPATWTIRGDASLPNNPFSDQLENLSSRPRTQAAVAWDGVFSWTAGVQTVSPNFGPVVEELVHRPDWNEGGTLGLLLEGTGQRQAWSFDGNAKFVPELWVIFDERDPITTAADVEVRTDVAEAGDGSRVLLASFHLMDSAPARGLLYTIEGSPNLEADSWESLNASFAGSRQSSRSGFSHLVFQVTLPDGSDWGEKYFLRLRVTQQ